MSIILPPKPKVYGTISFDLDGVLANFTRGFTRIGARLFGSTPGDQPSQASWIFEEVPELELTKERVGHPIKGGGMWAEVIKSPSFWANLDPINVSIMHTIDKIKNKVFITNRLGVQPREQSVSFLERWGVIEPNVIVAADKGPVAQKLNVTAHLDDYFPNCTDIAKAMPNAFVSLLGVPYNLQYRTPTTAPLPPRWSPARLWDTPVIKPAAWQGHVAMSTDHFIMECDKRGLIQWDQSYTVDKETRQLERQILSDELQKEAQIQ